MSAVMGTPRRSGMELAAEVAPAADAVAQAAAEAMAAEAAAEAAAADGLLHALLIALLPRARFAPPQCTEAGRATAADSLASLAIGTNAPLDGAMLRLLWQRPSAVMGTVDGGAAQPQHQPPPPPPPPRFCRTRSHTLVHIHIDVLQARYSFTATAQSPKRTIAGCGSCSSTRQRASHFISFHGGQRPAGGFASEQGF